MASLRVFLGFVPSTEKVESDIKALKEEYNRIQSIGQSRELARYEELNTYLNSPEFKEKKKSIESQNFKNTEEFKKEQEFLRLKKDKAIKNYFAIKKSKQLSDFQTMEESDQLVKYYELEASLKTDEFKKTKEYMLLSGKKKFEKSKQYKALQDYLSLKKDPALQNYLKFIKDKRFADYEAISNNPDLESLEANQEDPSFVKSKAYKNYKKMLNSARVADYLKIKDSDQLEALKTLEDYVTSDAFKQERKEIEQQKYNQTEEYKKESEFKALSKSKPFKDYFKFRDSAAYKSYLDLEGSDRIKEYQKLEDYVFSPQFKKVKDFMNQPAKKKFEQSEEKNIVDEFEQLKQNEDLKFYFKYKDHKKYDFIRNWSLSFEEDFSKPLDMNRWTPRYYWGDKLMKEGYSMVADHHLVSENNVETHSGRLRIITRKEKVKGKAWEPIHGFLEKEFDFTSGIINTGHSFRQKFGRFEAKIRFNNNAPVSHAFWMVSDKSVPHIDVVRADKTLSFNKFWRNGSPTVHKDVNKLKTSRYNEKFYIYALEWTENKIEWKINGISVAKQSRGIPHDPMYIAFSSGIYDDARTPDNLPAHMEVDWVRVYEAT